MIPKTSHREYLFVSDRLGFRNWRLSDIDEMHQINSDKNVMEFFPTLTTKIQTIEFIGRMMNLFESRGFCYFAVDKLEDNKFIGFIGLSEQTFQAEFTPCIDIGWRIRSSEWNKGYATEGAQKCLEYAFQNLELETIFSIAPKINTKSEYIMSKIGMTKLYDFEHPLLSDHERLKSCVVYRSRLRHDYRNSTSL